MKRDMAERLAATAVEGTPVKDVREILRAFLEALSRCSACEDTGTLAFAQPMRLMPVGGQMEVPIGKGYVGTCPKCGGLDAEGKPRGDPEFVAWRCRRGNTEGDCHHFRKGDDRRLAEDHGECGYCVMLPLSEPRA